MAERLFRRKKDEIEVRLNDAARTFVRGVFEQVVAAEHNPDHTWHMGLSAPIDPSRDADDPLAVLKRQSDTISNAELALATAMASSLNLAEAWAWVATLQVGLRSVAVQAHIHHQDEWAATSGETREIIESIQLLQSSLVNSL